MPPKLKNIKIIYDDNLEELYGIKFSKLTYSFAWGDYDLFRFKCEITPTGKKKIKDTVFFTVASIDSKDQIISSSVIEIDYKKFDTPALIDTCLGGNKDIISFNLYFSRFRPH